MNDNNVVFKGTKDGIVIMLDDKIPFEELEKNFKAKVEDAKDFFKNAKTAITFKGRALSESDETKLISIINTSCELNISYVNDNASDNPLLTPQFTEKSAEVVEDEIDENEGNLDKLLNKALHTAKKNLTTFHKGAVRSGQAIRFPGSVVVIGDVNPGGEVIAQGNIIILGVLKGLAHAGCNGAEECFVAALNMMPTQLRISEFIACFPPDLDRKNVPEYAYIRDKQIYVEPLL